MSRPDRVLVVGWDGAGWPLVDPLLDAGRLPHLARLLGRGVRSPLRSTIPPVTPAAWTAMATGLLPARSGVLGFRRLDLSRPSGFDPVLASSADLVGRTLFEHAAALGEPVALAGWPMTWPPLPLPGGVVLAGWPRPVTRLAPTWPRALSRRLGAWGEGETIPRHRAPTIAEEIASAAWWDRRHAEVAALWLRTRRDAIVACVLPGTDHLAHKLWGDDRLADHYARADAHLGELVAAAGDDAAVMLVSDHGFGAAAARRLHVDRWLEREGLQVRRADAATPGALGRAAATVRGRLPKAAWQELRGRLPPRLRRWAYERADPAVGLDIDGSVASRVELYESFVGLNLWRPDRTEALISALEAASWTKTVWRRDELFGRGPFADRIPAVVVELADGLRAGSGTGAGPIEEPVPADELRRWPATHRREGMMVLAGPGISGAPPREPGVEDVGPTMLALAGVAVPDDLDGRPLVESLDVAVRWVRGSGAEGRPGGGRNDPTLERSLRRLGYLS